MPSVKGAYVDIPEGRLHYRTAGSGPPLIINHPAGFGSVHFLDIIPLLATSYTVMAIDMFGHGESDPPPEPSTIVDGVRILAHFLDAHGIDRTNVLAQHTGAGISVAFATQYPERMIKIVLEGSPDWDEDVRVQLRQRTVGTQIEEDGTHLLEMWNGKKRPAKDLTTLKMVHRDTLAALQAMEHGFKVHRWAENVYMSETLPLVKCPILFLCGEHDSVARFVDAHISYVSPGVPTKKVILEGCGDYAASEKPEEFARHVLQFLGE